MHYTSGTTGQPKGVKRALAQIDPDTMGEMMTFMISLFGIQPEGDEVHLVVAPCYHTAVTIFGMGSLHMGHKIVLMDRWTPEECLEAIDRHQVTHSHMVPTMFHRMLALPQEVRERYDVSSMTHAIHSAAPCPVEIKQEMLAWWGNSIYEYYGATEGGGTIVTPEQWRQKPGTVGTPWPISTIKIFDDDGNEQPPGEVGTVWMSMGEYSFEYKGDKEKTDKSWRDGFFTVGDAGYLDDDGWLFLVDRKADMIIAGGVNIYPAEIEAALLTHPDVGDAAVFGVPHDDLGEQIKAVIEPTAGVAGDDATRERVMEHLRERLGKQKWPRSIDFIDEMPRDPNGKLYKRKLRDPYWEGRTRQI
jgi:long-chain acyl-CoA synthetase